MKFFSNKKIVFKLIVSLCICLTLINFGASSIVYADGAEVAKTGGKLLSPFIDLVMTIGDGVMDVVQKAIMGTPATIDLDLTTSIWGVVISAIVAIVACVALVVLTGGIGAFLAAIPAVGGVLSAIGGTAVVSGLVTIGIAAAGLGVYKATFSGYSAAFLPDYTVLPTYAISPEEIFEGKLLIFDINFFNPKEIYVAIANKNSEGDPVTNENGEIVITQRMKLDQWEATNDDGTFVNQSEDKTAAYYYYMDGNNEVRTSKQSSSWSLSKLISKWYYTLRNLALVVLMLILIYIGIRIMLCSIASEKSKYKKMLWDWVIAICLIFVMHYIMIFAVNINDNLISMMRSVSEGNAYVHVIDLTDMESGKRSKFKSAIEEANLESYYQDEAKNYFVWPTNLIGQIRILAQKMNGTSEYVGYAVAYIVLVLYTIYFAFTYLKRALYMAFLTVIAPMVAMTYPIDKINDGKAQAFNTWLKEYIFNLLIQPLHLLLYILLISMAFDLASTNIIYTLVAIGFMIPAEKLIRSMFGFEKAQTPGFLGGATGAALTMSTMQSLARLGGKGPGPKPGEKPNKAVGDGTNNDIYNRSSDSGHGFGNLLGAEEDFSTKLGEDKNQQGTEGPQNQNPQPQVESPQGGDDFTQTLMGTGNGSGENQQDMMDSADGLEQPQQNGRRVNISPKTMNPEKMEIKNIQDAMNKNDEDMARRREEQERAEQERIEKEKKQGMLATTGRMFKRAGGAAWKQIKTPENWAEATAKTLKASGKLAGAAVGTTIGAAAGIASGDMNNVIKNAALGYSAGDSLGNAIGGGAAGMVENSVSGVKNGIDEFNQERYGEDYSAMMKKKQDEKFLKDREARKTFAREFNLGTGKADKEKLDQIMKDAIKYREYGVTDNTTIIKAMNLDKNDRTSATSIASAMVASKTKDLKGVESYQKRLEQQVGSARAKQIADNAIKMNKLA